MYIDWSTFIIHVPKTDLTYVSPGVYNYDVQAFRLELRDLEDDEIGIVFPKTHSHNTQVTLAGVTYARTVEILSPYTVTFEDPLDDHYAVNLVGANHNLGDVTNINSVSIRTSNSAGLQIVESVDAAAVPRNVWEYLLDSTFSAEEMMRLMAASLAGKLSGANSTTVTIRDLTDTKDRIVATVDEFGNRSVVLKDVS